MGCGSSTPIDLTTVNGGMSSGLQSISRTRLGFVLEQKLFSFSGNSFAIKDNTGQEHFHVKGNASSLGDKMHVTDAAGVKVAVMQEKMLALRSTFYIYSYKPNFDGQESTETDQDGEGLYRYAFLEDQMLDFGGRQVVKRFLTSNEQDKAVGAFEIESVGTFEFTCHIKTYLTPEEKKKGGKQEVIATAGETTFFKLEGATSIGVEMAPGCDVLLVLLGMVAAEKISNATGVEF